MGTSLCRDSGCYHSYKGLSDTRFSTGPHLLFSGVLLEATVLRINYELLILDVTVAMKS